LFAAYNDLKLALEKSEADKLKLKNAVSLLETERDLLRTELDREFEQHRITVLNLEVKILLTNVE
jgi:hypothetical protein